jgi:putative hydrolase of the HAD superfamily
MHRACLIDALGTTLRLLPPWERLDPELVAGIDPARVRRAFEAEMAFYAAHAHEARDADSLSELRERSAAVLSAGLGLEIGVEPMMDAIAFEPYEDAAPALASVRALGLRTICVSNWDYALPEVLERAGLSDCFDGVVTSAAAGARKPEAGIFEIALEAAGCSAAEALHVGDSTEDVVGARGAGIEVLRIDRSGGDGDIASLGQIVEHLRR